MKQTQDSSFFFFLILHSCSFPVTVALDSQAGTSYRSRSPSLTVGLRCSAGCPAPLAACVALIQCLVFSCECILSTSGLLVAGLQVPSFVGCRHFVINSLSLLSSRVATVVLHFLLHGQEIFLQLAAMYVSCVSICWDDAIVNSFTAEMSSSCALNSAQGLADITWSALSLRHVNGFSHSQR